MKLLSAFRTNSNRTPLASIAITACLILLSACSTKALDWVGGSSSAISGSVVPFGGALSVRALAPTLTCPGATASLIEISQSGETILPAIQTIPVAADGTYTFTGLRTLGVSVKQQALTKPYLVEINGCNLNYGRVLTSTKAQDITFGTSLVAYMLNTPSAGNVAQASAAKLENLYSALRDFGSFADAYSALSSSTPLMMDFQEALVVNPNILEDAFPKALAITAPTAMREGEASALAIASAQWSTNYNYAYSWMIDGTQFSSAASTSYTPKGNFQGAHTLTLRLGQLDANGALDLSKPFQSKTFPILVENNVLPVPPALSAVSAAVNTPNVNLRIATGTSLANCETFSKLAITEDVAAPPFTPGEFNISCSSAPNQTAPFLLQNGLGPHTMYLWAMDSAGIISAVPSTFTVNYSIITPVITIASPAANLPNQGTLIVSGTCEDSSGDVTFSGNITPATSVTACVAGAYSKSITLNSSDGTKTITASQTNEFNTTGSVSVSVLKDTSAPSVTVASAAPTNSNATSISVTATFSEAVTGFNSGKIVTGNASVSAFSGSGTTYTFTLTPSGQGAYSIDIPANVGQDTAGNGNTAAANFSRTYDSVAPTVLLSSAVPSSTNLTDILVTATFSETVSNFSVGGLQLTNATASSLSGSGATYTFHLIPTAQGTASVSIAANAAQDAAGNGSIASSLLSRAFDSVAPTLTLSSAASDPTNATPIAVTATFSESVSGFTLSDIAVTNGSASGLAGAGASYTFNVTPSGNGPVSASVGNSAAQDASGNGNTGASIARVFNNVHPSVTIASVRTSPSRLAPFPITANFSADVTGFTAAGLTITNGTAGAISGSLSSYAFSITPTGQGDVSISINAAAAQDAALNTTLASNNLSITYDTVGPTLAFTSPAPSSFVNLANQAALSVSGTCSEEARTVSLSVGTVTGSATCSGGTFASTLDLTSLSDGALTLSANLADEAGNAATPATLALSKDISAPTATLAGAPSAPSNATTLSITVGGANSTAYKFKVGAAGATDCSVAGGYSGETLVATGITSSISALADGNVKLCAVARNAAGNYQPYASATSASWVKDTSVVPFSGLAISPLSPGNSSTPSVSGTIEASSAVKLYSAPSCGGSLLATGAASGAGSFSIAPGTSIGVDGSYSLSVQATDPAGNVLCSSAIPYVLDTALPLVTISSTAPASTNAATIPVSIAFSESVTGFSIAGINVTNGVASALSGGGASYTFSITPTTQGSVTAQIPAGVAMDVAGNTNPASLIFTRIFDTVQPNLTLTTPIASASVNSTSVMATGACETGLQINISGSGIASPSSTTCAASSFSVPLALTSGEGIKNLAFAQTDAAGNTNTITRTITLDTLVPSFIFTSVAVQNPITNTNFVTFAGTCETGLSIAVSGTDTNTVSCTGSAWTYTTVSRATDAARTYNFRQTDAAGNQTNIVGTWTRDTVLPALSLASPAANFAAQTSITLAGACETGISVVASGTGLLSTYPSIPCAAGAFSQLVFFSSGDGTKAVTVSQTDSAANVGSVSRSFVKDSTPPALTQTLRSSPYYTNTDIAQFGGACETGLSINVTGTDTASIACTSSAWTYTTVAQTTDATRSYTFTQTDAAGNVGQISASWVRDKIAPVLTLTSASNFVTSGSSVSFAGTCEAGLSIAVSGSQSATAPCSGGTWSFATNQSTDGNYSYTFTETDLAGNGSSATGSWTRSTSGPVITITQTSPQVTNGSSLIISGSCSGGTAGSNGVITITGAYSGTTPCSSTNATPGTWSYTATAGSDGNYNYNFSATDNFTTPRTSTAAITWTRDVTPPQITSGSFSINGGVNPTPVSFNPTSFSGTDNLTAVTKFCLKPSSAIPLSSDGCWIGIGSAGTGAVPSNSVSISNYSYNIGIIPQVYSIYLWVMDGAGNISSNSSVLGKDLNNVELAPITPPSVSTVLVSNADTMNGTLLERVIPAGSDLYIRWTASGTSLGANPVSIQFTSDDSTWASLANNLLNGNNNCPSLQGSGSASSNSTGCFKTSSPNSNYFKVRVTLANNFGATTFANSLPINASQIQILSGNTEPGLGGSATSAIFQANINSSPWADAQNIVVNSKGTVYFRDANLGIISISPSDGIAKLLIPLGATTSGVGDGGPLSGAKVRLPMSLALDASDRLLIFDYDRIRRVDFSAGSGVINTVIGGGVTTSDNIANPLALNITPNAWGFTLRTPMIALPNGDIYFWSDGSTTTSLSRRIRIFRQATNTIASLYLSGATTSVSNSTLVGNDFSKCGSSGLAIAFDPSSSAVQNFYNILSATSGSTCFTTAPVVGSYFSTFAQFDINSGVVNSLVPGSYVFSSSNNALFNATFLQAMDGKIYAIDKQAVFISQFDPATNSWTKVLGNGIRGQCPDGTPALSCSFEPAGGFVDKTGRLYFVDRGKIRTIQSGNVITLYGSGYDFGDGGLATNARHGLINTIAKTSDSKFATIDFVTGKIRLLSRNGNIRAIAGNGTANITTNITTPALNLPLAAGGGNIAMGFDSADNLIYPSGYAPNMRVLSNTFLTDLTTPWSLIRDSNNQSWFSGSTDYFSATANGAKAGTLRAQSLNIARIMGFSGTSVLYFFSQFTGSNHTNAVYGEIDFSTGTNYINYGPAAGTTTNTNCPDGSISNCSTFPYLPGNGLGTPLASYDDLQSQWLILGSGNRLIQSFGRGGSGSIQSVTTLSQNAYSLAAKRFPSHSSDLYVYYCTASDGKLRLRNTTSGNEAVLPWPVQSMKCNSLNLIYDDSTGSVITTFSQNGLNGIVEVLNAHPANYGL